MTMSSHCVIFIIIQQSNDKKMKNCAVTGCQSKANRVGAGLCEKHYMRVRRHGSTDIKRPKDLYIHTGGYIIVRAEGHPLSKRNVVYEHRKVYYDANGVGPFSCYHCGVTVTWKDMHVDHLSGVVTDNRLCNLVASCPRCNQWRGVDKMKNTMRMKVGNPITYNGETLSLNQWSERLGVARPTLIHRMRRMGMTPAEAFTKPMGATSGQRSERRNQAKEGKRPPDLGKGS